MKIITLPPQSARINTAARVLASFVAHLHAECRPGEPFDPAAACRLMLLAGVDLNTLVTPEGDAVLSELLNHSRRLELERERRAVSAERTKGGAA